MKLLDNIMWNCLAGPQARFASGEGPVRRYSRGFSAILGCEDPQHPDFAALEGICAPGEEFYIDIWSGPAPAGWVIIKEARMIKMVWQGSMPEEDTAPDALQLLPEHHAEMLEFARGLNPGPFGIRTPELGEYFGYFEDGKLIAMAGERMEAGEFREISGVCTHAEHRGRGIAAMLTLKLVHRQMQRGLTPFLHVMAANSGARGLYEKLGFRNYLETNVRVIARSS
jgi:ribosomal protein S18 acetylase RimI-like enzyme